jgi:hypothetical protein
MMEFLAENLLAFGFAGAVASFYLLFFWAQGTSNSRSALEKTKLILSSRGQERLSGQVLYDALSERLDKGSGLRLDWDHDEVTGRNMIIITGLLSNLEFGRDRPKWSLGSRSDVEIGAAEFDDQVMLQGDKLELYSRLDAEQRVRAKALVAAGLQIEFGQATFPYFETPFQTGGSYFEAERLDDLLTFLTIFAANNETGQQERLFELVRADPDLGVRVRVLNAMVTDSDGLTRELQALLNELIREDSQASGLMTEAEACAALADPSGIRAIAAVYWLRFRGGEQCRASLARAMNHPDAHPTLTAIANKALTSLERQFGAFSGGSLAIAETQEGGALSLAAEGGQLQLAAEEAARKRQGAKDGQKA